MRNIYLIILLMCFSVIMKSQITNNCVTTPVQTEIITTNIALTPTGILSITDTDGDGVLDIHEPEGDCDGDGKENFEDPDSDNDGIDDGEDECPCHPNPCPANPRTAFMLHGFSGDAGSWSLAADWLENQYAGKIVTHNEAYYEQQTSMGAAATAVASKVRTYIGLENLNNFNKGNFFIAHSLGGMILRNIEGSFTGYELPFDGIVSVGVGHQGAYAASTLANQKYKYEDALNYTCSKLLAPLVIESAPVLLSSVAVGINLLNPDKICDALDGVILGQLEKTMDNGIASDLTVESAAAWPTNTTKHNVALYGVEDDDVNVDIEIKDDLGNIIDQYDKVVYETLAPRFFGSAINSPTSYSLWGAGAADDEGLKTFAEAIINFKANEDKYRVRKKKYKLFIPISPLVFGPLYTIAEKKEKAFKEGLEWFPKINYIWKEIIGGIQNVTVTNEMCNCQYTYDDHVWTDYYYDEVVSNPGNCSDLDYEQGYETYQCYPTISISVENHESDGFILAESAKNMPNNTYFPIKMPGSNHYQMRNDENTGNEFARIFNTGLGLDYFNLTK